MHNKGKIEKDWAPRRRVICFYFLYFLNFLVNFLGGPFFIFYFVFYFFYFVVGKRCGYKQLINLTRRVYVD